MRMECQIIKTSHSFLTVIIIYDKSPAISQSLAPQSFPYRPPINPRSAEYFPLKLFLASEDSHLNPPSNIAFPDPFPSSVNKPSKNFLLKIHQSDLESTTQKTFCLLYGVQRYLLSHIPPHKGKTVQTNTFIWV